MKQLLAGICLCLAVIFFQTSYAEEKAYEFQTLAKGSQSWDGTTLPTYPTGAPEITIGKIIIKPGATLPFHQHPFINAGVVLSGELTVVTEHEKTLQLKAGNALIEVVNIWHYGKNTGSEPVEIIVFYAGTEGMPVTQVKY